MSLSQSLRWSGRGISNGRRRLFNNRNEIRQFSYNFSRPQLTASLRPQNTRTPSACRVIQQSRSISFFGLGSSAKPSSDEFATVHTSPQPAPSDYNVGQQSESATPILENARSFKASHATSDAPDPSILEARPVSDIEPTALKSLEDSIALPHGTASADSIADITEPDLASIPEGIGYLKDVCGLDYGWGPTAMLEWSIEHLHIYSGLGWSASIVAVAFLARLIALRWTVKAADQNLRSREIKPILDPLRQQYKEALTAQDRLRAMAIGNEIRTVSKEAGVSIPLMMAPMLIQIPLTFGGFRLLRGAATLPVPAFETETWLWHTNLTLGDPFVLPIAGAALTFLTMRSNFATGQTPLSPEVMSAMLYGLPILSLGFMYIQPGAVQLWFFSNSVFSLAQTLLLRNDGFRRMVGLMPLPPPTQPTTVTDETPSAGGLVLRKPAQIEPEAPEVAAISNRSFIDRAVDGFKEKRDAISTSAKKTMETAMGSVKDKQKEKRNFQTDKYEYARRQDLEHQRQYRNQAAANSSDKKAGQVAGMKTSRSIAQRSKDGM